MTEVQAVEKKLQGKLLKYTMNVKTKQGDLIEFQSNNDFTICLQDGMQEPVLCIGYSNLEFMIRISEVVYYKKIENTL
jgi:hypothetical protein